MGQFHVSRAWDYIRMSAEMDAVTKVGGGDVALRRISLGIVCFLVFFVNFPLTQITLVQQASRQVIISDTEG